MVEVPNTSAPTPSLKKNTKIIKKTMKSVKAEWTRKISEEGHHTHLLGGLWPRSLQGRLPLLRVLCSLHGSNNNGWSLHRRLNTLEWLKDMVEGVFVLFKSNDMAPKLPACMDRSPCCGGNVSKGKKKNLEIENYDMLASELGHTNACINVHHNMSNVRSGHYQRRHESNIFLPGTMPRTN
jgi:hypothetical protein